MTRHKWKLTIDRKVADRFDNYEPDARYQAKWLSYYAPLLEVQLHRETETFGELNSTWKNGMEVK